MRIIFLWITVLTTAILANGCSPGRRPVAEFDICFTAPDQIAKIHRDMELWTRLHNLEFVNASSQTRETIDIIDQNNEILGDYRTFYLIDLAGKLDGTYVFRASNLGGDSRDFLISFLPGRGQDEDSRRLSVSAYRWLQRRWPGSISAYRSGERSDYGDRCENP